MLSVVVLTVVSATRIPENVLVKLATLVELAPTSMEKLLLLFTKLAVLSNVLFAHTRKQSAVVLTAETAIRKLETVFVRMDGLVVPALDVTESLPAVLTILLPSLRPSPAILTYSLLTRLPEALTTIKCGSQQLPFLERWL